MAELLSFQNIPIPVGSIDGEVQYALFPMFLVRHFLAWAMEASIGTVRCGYTNENVLYVSRKTENVSLQYRKAFDSSFPEHLATRQDGAYTFIHITPSSTSGKGSGLLLYNRKGTVHLFAFLADFDAIRRSYELRCKQKGNPHFDLDTLNLELLAFIVATLQ